MVGEKPRETILPYSFLFITVRRDTVRRDNEGKLL